GGVDEVEDPRSAAVMELREETGVSSAEVIAEVSGYGQNFSLVGS
ncbi:nudix hydrolase 26, partial [Quercus suber]